VTVQSEIPYNLFHKITRLSDNVRFYKFRVGPETEYMDEQCMPYILRRVYS
jgi:hypothetical protein